MDLRRWQTAIEHGLSRGWLWLRTVRGLETWGMVVSLLIMLVLLAVGIREHPLPWVTDGGETGHIDWRSPAAWSMLYEWLAPYLKVAALLSGLVFHLAVQRARGDLRRLLPTAWIICSLFAVWVGAADFHEQWQRVHGTITGRPFPLGACSLKVVLLILGMLSPAVGLTYYQSRPIWERHVLRLFAQPLVFCLLAFCSLRLLADFLDSFRDFQENHVPFLRVITFYFDMLPAMFVQSCTPALLLAVLYALLKLVRGNELVSLICCGLSLPRVLRPLLMCTAGVCFVAMVVNYEAAQQAESERQAVMRGIESKEQASVLANAVTHYHQSTHRLWFVSVVPFNFRTDKLRGVQVRQFDEQGRIQRSWTASSAVWLPDGTWRLSRGVITFYENGTKTGERSFNSEATGHQFATKEWSETLWDIVSTTQTPDMMGVPDLASFVQTHAGQGDARVVRIAWTELWHRLSFPWQALPLVLVVASIIPIHARRGVAQPVAIGIGFYLLLLFLNSFTINLARGSHLPAGLAMWLPHLLLAGTGLLVLWVRSGVPWKLQKHWRGALRTLRGRRTWSADRCGAFFLQNPDLRSKRQG